MNETHEKMLTERGVIVLPETIEHETYRDVLALLLLAETAWVDKPIRMFCAGNGGSAPAAIAIVDLIRAHGNVIGMLAGQADSSHAVIWAGCKARYIYPYGSIGVHCLKWDGLPERQDRQSMRHRENELLIGEAAIAAVIGDACDAEHGSDFWLEAMRKAGSDGVKLFTSGEVLMMGMARPISEYNSRVPVFTTGVSGQHQSLMFDNLKFMRDGGDN